MLRKVLKPVLVLVEAVLLAWAMLFLAEYFGWRVVREAGGQVSGSIDGGTTL
jgi:hypothetical protein